MHNCYYRDRKLTHHLRERINSSGRERPSIIRDNYVDAALLRVGTIRFRPAEFRISFASSKQDPHYRCGGTVTVRFRFSFSPRFTFSIPFFFLFTLVTWKGTRREPGMLWGARKGWTAPRGCHARCTACTPEGDRGRTICTPLEILRSEILRKSFLSELSKPFGKRVLHNTLSNEYFILAPCHISPPSHLRRNIRARARVNNVIWKITSVKFVYRQMQPLHLTYTKIIHYAAHC